MHGVRINFKQRGVVGKLTVVSFLSFLCSVLASTFVVWQLTELLTDFMPAILRKRGHVVDPDFDKHAQWQAKGKTPKIKDKGE